MEIEGFKDIACSCNTCKDMCKKSPCLGTPEDILKIINAGFGDKVAQTVWAVGFIHGVDSTPTKIIAPIMTENGCSFLNDENLCILHDLDLKPTEGRLSLGCGNPNIVSTIEDFKNMLTYKIVETWKG